MNQQHLCRQSIELGFNPVLLSASQYHQHPQHDCVALVIVDTKNYGNQIITSIKNNQAQIYPKSQTHPPILALVNVGEHDLTGVYQCGALDYISCPLITNEVVLRINQGWHYYQANAKKDCQTEHLTKPSIKPTLPLSDDTTTEHALRNNTVALLANSTADYLNSQLARDIKLSELSKVMGVNRTKLMSAFKACFGMPIFQWLREQRLLIAAKLLTSTSDSILRIAEQVGYPDPNYFSTVFKRAFGLSPQQYRKQQQQKFVQKTKIWLHKTKVDATDFGLS